MRRLLKWLGWSVVVLAVLVAGVFGAAWAVSERALSRTWAVRDPPLADAMAASSVDHGRHLFATRGCADCHGADGAGKLLVDAPNVIRIVPSNLTRTVRDPAWTDDRLAAAIRHGVRPDGTGLVIMPTGDYDAMDDHDVASIVAYLRTLPTVDTDPGRTQVRPLARVLYMFGKFPLVPAERVDHAPRERVAPPATVSVAYGQYVAQVCTGFRGRSRARTWNAALGEPHAACERVAGLEGKRLPAPDAHRPAPGWTPSSSHDAVEVLQRDAGRGTARGVDLPAIVAAGRREDAFVGLHWPGTRSCSPGKRSAPGFAHLWTQTRSGKAPGCAFALPGLQTLVGRSVMTHPFPWMPA